VTVHNQTWRPPWLASSSQCASDWTRMPPGRPPGPGPGAASGSPAVARGAPPDGDWQAAGCPSLLRAAVTVTVPVMSLTRSGLRLTTGQARPQLGKLRLISASLDATDHSGSLGKRTVLASAIRSGQVRYVTPDLI
jgi:hypothetical protein